MINADNKVASTLAYGADGYLSSSTDSEGYTVQYQHDNLGRVVLETFPDSSTRSFQYKVLDLHVVTDRQARTTTYDHDADRNLVRVTDPLGNVRLHVRRVEYQAPLL